MNKTEFIAYFNENDCASASLGIQVVDMGEGIAEAVLPFSERCKNFMGTMHGGALATLADIAAGCSQHYRGRMCVTLDANVRYLQGVHSGNVRAYAKQKHAGGRIAVIEVEMKDDAGALCAIATVSMYLTNKPLQEAAEHD